MTPEITIRAFSNDQFYLDRTFYSNIYKIKSFKPDSVVLDIGAHVGYFTINAVIRGAKKVYAIEPFKYNHECLIRNTQSARDSVVASNFAVLFDDSFTSLSYPEYNKCFDFGEIELGNDSAKKIEKCPSFRLDTILSDYILEKDIDLIKINVGGGLEPEILMSSSFIPCAKSICGLTIKNSVSELEPLCEKMKSNGFVHQKIMESGENGEYLFFFSEEELSNIFEV